jgi:hypothetical protein
MQIKRLLKYFEKHFFVKKNIFNADPGLIYYQNKLGNMYPLPFFWGARNVNNVTLLGVRNGNDATITFFGGPRNCNDVTVTIFYLVK